MEKVKKYFIEWCGSDPLFYFDKEARDREVERQKARGYHIGWDFYIGEVEE